MPNIYQSLTYHALRQPDAIAVVDGDKTFTFPAFAEYARRYAACLTQAGIQRGDRVFALLENSADYLALYHATALTGFILVPVNVRLSTREIAWMIGHGEPKIVLYDPRNAHSAEAVRAACGADVQWVAIEDLPIAESIPDFDPQIVESGSVDDDDVALIIYTSGTTSLPKGAMLRHAGLVWNSINYQIELGINKDCRAVLAAPLFHIGGYGVINGPILAAGGQLSMLSRFESEAIISHLRTYTPTHLFLLSPMWVSLTDHPGFGDLRFPDVRYVQTAAAPLAEYRQELIRKVFPNAEFGWGFGLTEACVTIFKNRTTAEILSHPGSVGYRWPHFSYRLVDEEGQILTDPFAEGALEIKGPTIFAGYWNDAEATRSTLLPDGWMRTGDLIRFDKDGFAYFVGRAKDMVKTGGENVSALEVEIGILEHPDVSEAAAYGAPHDYWGEELRAAVVPVPGRSVDTEALLQFCRGRLTGFKIPKKITVVDTLPKSSSGKVQKFKLKDMLK